MSQPSFLPHYTYGDYCQWQGDWELHQGIPIAMTPSPFGRHQLLVTRLAWLIQSEIEANSCDCQAIVELDWVVSDDTVVRPDLMVVCGEIPDRHLQSLPAMVIEVLSPSTRTNDLGYKRELYQRERIPHYLIIETETSVVTPLTLQHGHYISQTIETASLTVNLTDGCTITIDQQKLFR
ncbi:Uma2 family endonuclease [Stieleria sp. ICT_E10.1]|uniref:Uma2 family endonuclease n=1 Tax=Stieleria sedimenti TaxID=2976331 RepID=UPI00218013D0|nr:Uma2 family endonuclease [Stieleria sedimenti]MCS7466776.1 Uma2 family endonuclease [Stieleria sedimenti]